MAEDWVNEKDVICGHGAWRRERWGRRPRRCSLASRGSSGRTKADRTLLPTTHHKPTFSRVQNAVREQAVCLNEMLPVYAGVLQ